MLKDAGDYRGAANRSYYSIYSGIRSVLALDGVDFKRHSGTITYFRKEYIKTGIFDKKMSEIVESAFDIRSDSDYEDFVMIDKLEIEEQIENAEEFYEMII